VQCHFPQERLSDYIDGQLIPEEMESTRRHLHHCQECMAVVESYQAIGSSIHALLGSLHAPEEIEASVLQRLEMMSGSRQTRHLFEVYLAGMAVAFFVLMLLIISPIGRFVHVMFRLMVAMLHGLIVMSSVLQFVWIVGVGAFMIMVLGLSLVGIRRMLHSIQKEAVL
jgi:anti-sigma factor RsiW